MNTYNNMCSYTGVYLLLFEYLYKHRYFVIHTTIRVLLVEYTYNYMSFYFLSILVD